MVDKKNLYVGSIETELEAARVYDILLILTKGLQVSARAINLK